MSQVRVATCDYDEDTGIYRSFQVYSSKDDIVASFATGDPVADHDALLAHCDELAAQDVLVVESSSITHFVFDNHEYRFHIDADGVERLVKA